MMRFRPSSRVLRGTEPQGWPTRSRSDPTCVVAASADVEAIRLRGFGKDFASTDEVSCPMPEDVVALHGGPVHRDTSETGADHHEHADLTGGHPGGGSSGACLRRAGGRASHSRASDAAGPEPPTGHRPSLKCCRGPGTGTQRRHSVRAAGWRSSGSTPPGRGRFPGRPAPADRALQRAVLIGGGSSTAMAWTSAYVGCSLVRIHPASSEGVGGQVVTGGPQVTPVACGPTWLLLQRVSAHRAWP